MLERLENILRVQSESFNQWRMFKHIIYRLKAIEGVTLYVDNGNIYATKGIALVYPCVVAHMDTVHDIAEDLTLLTVGNKITGFNTVTMRQTGVGGDDKVGIYIALECMEMFDNMKVALFRDEEVGCMGSMRADLDFFEDCSFVLQCDRQGNSDFITSASGTKLSSKQFQKTIKGIVSKYGYKYAYGMMTDVMQLKDDGLEISCANMSCGYWNPHTAYEYVNIDDVNKCMNMVVEIIQIHGTTAFPHTPEYTYKRVHMTGLSTGQNSTKALTGSTWVDRTYADGYDNDFEGYKSFDDWYETNKQKKGEPTMCESCSQSDVPLKFVVEVNSHLCADCRSWLVGR